MSATTDIPITWSSAAPPPSTALSKKLHRHPHPLSFVERTYPPVMLPESPQSKPGVSGTAGVLLGRRIDMCGGVPTASLTKPRRHDWDMAAHSGTVVELRVHGVSGTPPEALLSCPMEFLEQRRATSPLGFTEDNRGSRTRDVAERRAHGGSVTEAYSWGGLTSGPASRAVWLLFLPFIFINLAHWMLPPAPQAAPAAAVSVAPAAADRAVVHPDPDARRRGGGDGCDGLAVHGFGLLRPHTGVRCRLCVSAAREQVALSAVPLVVVIAVLWRLGRENTRVIGSPPNPAVMADEVPLESDTFWCNRSVGAAAARLPRDGVDGRAGRAHSGRAAAATGRPPPG